MIQKYIEQLAEDMRETAEMKRNQASLINKTVSTDLHPRDDISWITEYMNGPKDKISAIVGIDTSLLPADDLLSDEQTGLLVPEMVSLLNAFNFCLDFPQNNDLIVPPRLYYRALREKWDSEQVIAGLYVIHLEFCGYDEQNCPFPGYCDTCSESLGDELDFIPSISNYCDRWCENCQFTTRCRTFDMENEYAATQDTFKISTYEYVEDIEDRLAAMIPPGSYEDFNPYNYIGLEYSDLSYDIFSVKNKAGQHPVSLLTHTYSESSHFWLNAITKSCRTEFTRWLAIGYADQILNAIETVDWYHFFIYPKILRALSGHFELEEDECSADDMNGSAKVVLIAIDWSIEAYAVLKRHLTTHRTEIIRFTELLESLRNDIEKLFPDARSFIRPGLDE
jgi:hypothetical protein